MKNIAKIAIVSMCIVVGGFVLVAPPDVLSVVINVVGRILISVFIVALGFYLAEKS